MLILQTFSRKIFETLSFKNCKVLYQYNSILKRSMINSRCVYTMKTAFACIKTISNNAMLDEISNENTAEFDNQVGLLALNVNLGTPQHKKAILGHIFNYRYNTKRMYALSPHEPVGPSAHVITELPLCEMMFENFGVDIKSVEITSDTVPVIMEGQKQSNLDYIFNVTSNHVDKTFGFGHTRDDAPKTIQRFHDCKDGSGMFKHSTRGTVGLLVFDSSGKNIQTLPYVFKDTHFFDSTRERLDGLKNYLMSAGLYEKHFSIPIEKCRQELESGKSIFDINLTIENILWNDIQRHPAFPRSVSFVFCTKTTFDDQHAIGDGSESNFYSFQQKLLSLLNPNKNATNPYNLSKKGDMKEYYTALLKAYQTEQDPDIVAKLRYLQMNGIPISNLFNEILTHYTRHGS